MPSGKITFHVVRHLDGLDWPVSFEFEIKGLGDVEGKIKWLRERNFTPANVVDLHVKGLPDVRKSPPMPQHVAIPPGQGAPSYLPSHQVCPVHGGSMAASKFEDEGWSSTHYCRKKTGEKEYCKIRCGLDPQGVLRWANVPGQK